MRYALYFTPPQLDPLTVAAANWLGRDAFTGVERPDVASMAASEIAPRTAARRYGFHATLKAPFELASGETETTLRSAIVAFAATRQAFDISCLVISRLDGFFALIPAMTVPALQAFAADVVESFDRFRAPLTHADLARRNPDRLTADQRRNLMQWGYPHVMDEFQFHMTLTDRIAEPHAPDVRAALDAVFAPLLDQAVIVDALSLFVEPEPGAPFTVLQHEPLARGDTA